MTLVAERLSHRDVEQFLYEEAELLDDWRLPEWAELFTEDSVYEVTSLSSSTPLTDDFRSTLFLVADRIDRIRGRASRLMKPTAHAEYPRSKTRHMVSNVRVKLGDDGDIRARANFVVFRTKEDTTTSYMGEYHYILKNTDDGLKILQKRIILDLNSLYDQGRLTIIL
jgi:p-cumate 2,3-dioxygenase beta subunit